MRNLIEFINNSSHPNMVNIPYDQNFGDEQETLRMVRRLERNNLITINDSNYTRVQVKIETEFHNLIENFGSSIEEYEKSKKIKSETIFNYGTIQIGHNNTIGDGNNNELNISINFEEREKLTKECSEILDLIKKDIKVSKIIRKEMLAGFEVIFEELQKPESNSSAISKTLIAAKKYGEVAIFGHELIQAIAFFSLKVRKYLPF